MLCMGSSSCRGGGKQRRGHIGQTKQSLRIPTIDVAIPLCKAESESIIKEQMQIVWQEYWDLQDTGRHRYNIQRRVRLGRNLGRNRREEAVIT